MTPETAMMLDVLYSPDVEITPAEREALADLERAVDAGADDATIDALVNAVLFADLL